MIQIGDRVIFEGRPLIVHEVTRKHEVAGAFYARVVENNYPSHTIEARTFRVGYERANYEKNMVLVAPAGPDEIEAMFS